MKNNSIYFNKNLEYLLESRKIQQNNFATLLNVSSSTLNNWIKGKASPNFEVLKMISDLLNTSIDDLLRIDLSKNQIIIDNSILLNEPETPYLKSPKSNNIENEIKIELIENERQLYERLLKEKDAVIELYKTLLENQKQNKT